MENRNKIADEIDKLISLLDEDIDVSCQRVGFMLEGKVQKARFADEKMRPAIHKKILKQLEITKAAFNQNKYGETD